VPLRRGEGESRKWGMEREGPKACCKKIHGWTGRIGAEIKNCGERKVRE
jgi:hypothetical protein